MSVLAGCMLTTFAGASNLPQLDTDNCSTMTSDSTTGWVTLDLGYIHTEVPLSELSINHDEGCIEVRYKDSSYNCVMWDEKRGITVPDLDAYENFNTLNLRVNALLYDFGKVFGMISRGLKKLGLTMKSRMNLRKEQSIEIKTSDILNIKNNSEALNLSQTGILHIEKLIENSENEEFLNINPNYMIDELLPSLVDLYEIHIPF